ncbi:MAG: hypothetical protein PHY40_02920 [Patescibacteria group bacterium]|jgi:uncharacterized membrane protein YkgB|nr:hypothetical protein [Patescibacteria group bacterium]
MVKKNKYEDEFEKAEKKFEKETNRVLWVSIIINIIILALIIMVVLGLWCFALPALGDWVEGLVKLSNPQ